MKEIPKSKSICGRPVHSVYVDKNKYLRMQTYHISDITPPTSENESLFVLVKHGHGSIIINGVEFKLKVGAFLWLQSYHTFTIKCESDEPLELKICVYDYPLSSFLTFREPTPTAIDAIMDATPVVYLEGKFLERVYDLFDDFEEFDDFYDPGSSLIKVSILGELSKIFIDHSMRVFAKEEPSPKPLGWNAILYISEYFGKDLTAEKVAKLFDSNSTTLNRELRNISGYNFIQTLNRVRVNIAASALLYEDMSLSYIATHSGFSSEVVFYRIFKQYVGVTPVEYRKQIINHNEDKVYRGMIMSTSLMQILNHAYDNFSSSVDLKDASKSLFLSESTIRNIIFDKFGTNYKYIIFFNRIRHSEALLLTTDLPILDIAINVGFNCSRSFSRAFNKFHNMTPSEYRNMYRGVNRDE